MKGWRNGEGEGQRDRGRDGGRVGGGRFYMQILIFLCIIGPTDNSTEDFWRMIWEQRVPTIVMLTRIFEGRVSEPSLLRLLFRCCCEYTYIQQNNMVVT